MVREASRRQRKFEAKVDADVLRTQTLALKPLMVKGQAEYFPNIAMVESKVKTLVEAEGVSTLEVRDYINFAREMYKLSKKFSSVTLQAEAQNRVDKWVSRGLVGSLLVKIANLFGVSPTAPPTPPTILKLDDLEDVEITAPTDKQLLVYEASTLLWKNKSPWVRYLDDLLDVKIIEAGMYDLLTWDINENKWVNKKPEEVIPNWQTYGLWASSQGAMITRWYGLNYGPAITSEQYAQTPLNKGTFYGMRINMASNTTNGDTVFTLRKNGANTDLVLTFGAGETGIKEIAIPTTIEENDLVCLQVRTYGSTGTVFFNPLFWFRRDYTVL